LGKINYGVVEYYNYSFYSALGLNDYIFLPSNYEFLIKNGDSLFAYMHPIKENPGPFRLTNILLSKLAWSDLQNEKSSIGAKEIIRDFFKDRYGDFADEWENIYRLMSESVQNAKEMFLMNSLADCLFQDILWSRPPYKVSQILNFMPFYLKGGKQSLPARFSGMSTAKEVFRGLDESIELQNQAAHRYEEVLTKKIPKEVRRRMESDLVWFEATRSRYHLIQAAVDCYLAKHGASGDLSKCRARMTREINFLESSPVTKDTISPVNQRSFLAPYRALANMTP
jgi:hypothetical protein